MLKVKGLNPGASISIFGIKIHDFKSGSLGQEPLYPVGILITGSHANSIFGSSIEVHIQGGRIMTCAIHAALYTFDYACANCRERAYSGQVMCMK